jgi:hypothetical protein
MATPNWGLLVKSNVDDETIEEAIARLVSAHNDDEESHLGEGQALQSHKASEVIDHAVESIINDKVQAGAITADKMFSFSGPTLDIGSIVDFSTFATALVGSSSVVSGLRYLKLAAGSSFGDYACAYKIFGAAPGSSGNARFVFRVYMDEALISGGELWIKWPSTETTPGYGGSAQRLFGIRIYCIDDEHIGAYGFVRRDASLWGDTLSVALEYTKSYLFGVEMIKNGANDYDFVFYIDGVEMGRLESKDITPLPSDEYLVFALKDNGSDAQEILIFDVGYRTELL